MSLALTAEQIEQSMMKGLINFLTREYGSYIEIAGAHEEHIKFFTHEMGLILENNNPYPVTVYYDDEPVFHIEADGVGLMDCEHTDIDINEFEVRIENAFSVDDVFFHMHDHGHLMYVTNNTDNIVSVLYKGVKLIELNPNSKQKVVFEGSIFRNYLDIVS